MVSTLLEAASVYGLDLEECTDGEPDFTDLMSLAVRHNHAEVVKRLLQDERVDIDPDYCVVGVTLSLLRHGMLSDGLASCCCGTAEAVDNALVGRCVEGPRGDGRGPGTGGSRHDQMGISLAY